MDAVGDGLAQIVAERRREPQLLGRRQAQQPWRRRRLRRDRLRGRPAEHIQQRTRRGDLFRRGGWREACLLEFWMFHHS